MMQVPLAADVSSQIREIAFSNEHDRAGGIEQKRHSQQRTQRLDAEL
eukprot:COSAG02_NODE_4174_length_5669_cov_16.261580_3_plen_47_part_00